MKAIFTMIVVLAILPKVLPPAQAQTYKVLYSFTGLSDGSAPMAGVTIDGAGNLYGTTSAGGNEGFGNVYRLVHSGSTWNFYLLYTFQGFTQWSQDGGSPYARVTLGPDGALYGTTRIGGNGDGCREDHGCGTVFKLQQELAGSWTETVLYQFGYLDGDHPLFGDVVFDSAASLYGTTIVGGANSYGTIYRLIHANGSWTEQVLYSFNGTDGSHPLNGATIDARGNLYGTTSTGGAGGWGTAFRLEPSDSSWVESTLHSFRSGSDGLTPSSGLILDPGGNLFGVTETGDKTGCGTVFELTQSALGQWNINNLFSFDCAGSTGSYRTLARDSAGNLYGTTAKDGFYHQGSIFKLKLSWTYTSLHDFTGGSDGGFPYGVLSVDAAGAIYGTASAGGNAGHGLIFQIMP